MRSATLLALIGGAAASPAVNLQAAFCSAVTKGISAVSQQASATAFCSSYLSIPLKTAVVTSTSYTSTYTAVSTTTTTTQVVTAPVVTDVVSTSTTSFTTTTFTDTSTTTTDTTYVLATSTITSCANPTNPSKLKQRALPPPAIIKPSALASYAIGAPVSSACSCLSIAPSTTTVTTVTSMVKTVSSTTSIGTITTTTPHTTSTSTSIITSLISTTTTTWSSVQATSITGTTTIVSLPTFQIKVVGGSNNGAYAGIGNYGSGTIGVAVSGYYSPSNFYLNGTNLVAADGAYAGEIADEQPNKVSGDSELVMFDSAADIAAAGTDADVLACSLAANQDGTCPLTCAVNGGTLNFDCGTWWRIQQPGMSLYCSNTFSTYAVST